jgi:hypothetical protein
MHQSIATIDSPEFINLQPLDINPLMSSCEIKVLYLGENRNKSFITKEVATEMAKTLRGAPIVGYYKSEKQDFADHGNKITFDDEGIKFECMTRPYGFVSPDAKVWFQKFEDHDVFGNSIQREYLMTTGYLWTGQYEECKCAVEGEGRPHSMELDEETLNGEWTKNYNTNMEFFIINDAIFSKLCILGEDVEPCFEGSSVKAPEVSKTFSLDNDFKQTLYTMMQDLKTVLGGGEHMEGLEKNFSNEQDNLEQNQFEENQVPIENENPDVNAGAEPETSFKKEEEDKKEGEPAAPEKKETEEEPKKDDSEEDEEKKKEKEKYSLLESEFEELKRQYSALQEEYNGLVSFKNQIENEKKDELINSFYMLSDEDKAEVIANKTNYSLDDIEAKLSVICVRKKVNFSLDEETPVVEKENPAVTFNLESQASDIPAWVSALRNTQNSRNI